MESGANDMAMQQAFAAFDARNAMAIYLRYGDEGSHLWVSDSMRGARTALLGIVQQMFSGILQADSADLSNDLSSRNPTGGDGFLGGGSFSGFNSNSAHQSGLSLSDTSDPDVVRLPLFLVTASSDTGGGEIGPSMFDGPRRIYRGAVERAIQMGMDNLLRAALRDPPAESAYFWYRDGIEKLRHNPNFNIIKRGYQMVGFPNTNSEKKDLVWDPDFRINGFDHSNGIGKTDISTYVTTPSWLVLMHELAHAIDYYAMGYKTYNYLEGVSAGPFDNLIELRAMELENLMRTGGSPGRYDHSDPPGRW